MTRLPREGSARFCKSNYEAGTEAVNVPVCSTEVSAAWMQPYDPILLRFFLRKVSKQHGVRFFNIRHTSEIPLQVIHKVWCSRVGGVGYRHGWRYIMASFFPIKSKISFSSLSCMNTSMHVFNSFEDIHMILRKL